MATRTTAKAKKAVRKPVLTDKGVVVEYDFAAMDGAKLLGDVVTAHLAALDKIAFDPIVEARYLAGREFQDGLAAYFSVVKTKKTAAKAAREIDATFRARLAAVIPKTVSQGFRNFVQAIVDGGAKVVIATRAPLPPLAETFAPIIGDRVILHHVTATSYGALRPDGWRRVCAATEIRPSAALAVTGSGYGVRSALLAGLGSMAVLRESVAYQDFGGADEVLARLDSAAAKKALGILHLD